MPPPLAIQSLVIALVGTKHQHAYQTSPTFYAQINQLAQMLPLWIDGLEAESVKLDEHMEKLNEYMMRGPL